MRLTCLGGAGEIGANSYYLHTGTLGLLLDAGLHPKKEGAAALPRFDAVDDEVDHILVTHAHLDHVGALPRAHRRFPRARVHMSIAAWRFAHRMLRNSVNVMRRQAEDEPGLVPLYGFEDLDELADLVETHDENAPFRLGRGVHATFVSAGHIPGAAGLLLESEGARGRRFFYTGDTCSSAQSLIPGARYPEGPLDALLMETTYGANVLADGLRREEVLQRFTNALRRVVEGGGVALVPVFALGRAQEMLFLLWAQQRKGRLPARVPIYLTGLARAITRVYDEARLETPRRDPRLRLEHLGFEVLDDEAFASGAPDAPAIVLASSGMLLPNTLSNRLARRVLPEPDSAVFIVGYQDPDTPGYHVQQSQDGERIDLADGLPPVVRRAAVERFHFRAHSSRAELLQAARRMRPRLAVLVHGDPGASESLGTTLAQEGGRLLQPLPTTPYDLG